MSTATNPDVSLLSDIRLNVLVVAPEDSPMAGWLRADPEHEFEVHHVVTPSDAWRLLSRGKIAVLVLDGKGKQEGMLQLLVESLQFETAPVSVLVSVEGSRGKGLWKRMRESNAATLLKAVKECCEEFVSRKNAPMVTPHDLLLAAAAFPEDAWFRAINKDEAGDLCIRGGRAVYSEVGRLGGAEAAARILSWGLCRVEHRQLPGFLSQNMDCGVLELAGLDGTAGEAVTIVAPAVGDEAAAKGAIEEPEAEEPGDPLWLMEPDEPPAFAGNTEGFEAGVVDEPAEMPAFDLDAPEPPEFDFGAEFGEEEEAAAGAASVSRRGSVVASVAILAEGSGGLESCDPAADSCYFDPATLRALYEHSRQYAQRHKLGLEKAVLLFCGSASIAITPIPGSRRLLAVRLTGREYGEAEQNEVRRLQEQALLAGDPVGT